MKQISGQWCVHDKLCQVLTTALKEMNARCGCDLRHGGGLCHYETETGRSPEPKARNKTLAVIRARRVPSSDFAELLISPRPQIARALFLLLVILIVLSSKALSQGNLEKHNLGRGLEFAGHT